MKSRLLSIIALAGILSGGCAVKENFSLEGGAIIAEIESDRTRTSVTDEGAFTWSAGDQVWLHTTSGHVTGTLSSGAGTSSAKFSFGSYFGEMTGKAVYPHNAGHNISGDVLSVVMPASYDLGSSLGNTNAAMLGVNVGGTIKFNHMAGVMRFKFKNVPAGVNMFTITLDKKINGTFEADLTEEYPVIETSASSSDSEKTITLNFDAMTEVSDISIYVPLPLGTYETIELGFYDDDQPVWTYSNTVTNTINRKSLKLMPVVSLGGGIDGEIEGGETPDDAVNLSDKGAANSYIVSSSGLYKFSTVKGNSNESFGAIDYAEVLWESFGTDVTPNVGDLVKNAVYSDGYITFQTADTFKEGNAVIAAKDASGTIIWSWHIWLTDEPQGQVYYNNAGIMMDRNLGATSSMPGDVGTFGLLYQWGRKDPFLGTMYIGRNTTANSTIIWPSAVLSDSINGTIEYSTAHPTTFITRNSKNDDWYYTGYSSTDNTRWTTSETSKSIYDPCPVGWRVPDGGSNGVWSKAKGSSSSFCTAFNEEDGGGVNFFNIFGDNGTIWYPAAGFIYGNNGILGNASYVGEYWSVCPSGSVYLSSASRLAFDFYGEVWLSGDSAASAKSVRCVKETN